MGRKDDIHPVDPTRQLPGDEVADVFRRIGRGEVPFEPAEVGRRWGADDPGTYAIRVGGYEIILFNDNGSVDYVEKAIAPDGRKGSFRFWIDRGQEPVQRMGPDDVAALEARLTARLRHR